MIRKFKHRRLQARSPGNHQADRLAATKYQLVAELQPVRALQEATQVNERISTLEAELAAEQERSASHLADYEQERDRANRLAATKYQLVAELQAVRALQEAAQVIERISTLEAELAAEQQRLASHLADYEQERDRASYAVLRTRAGELLSECISNGPHLLNRALRRVMMSAVQVETAHYTTLLW